MLRAGTLLDHGRAPGHFDHGEIVRGLLTKAVESEPVTFEQRQ